MKIKKFLIALTAVTMAQVGMAYADNQQSANPEHKHEGMFKEADTNGDGKVSFDEFKAEQEKRSQEIFKKIDTNSDGYVDQAEMKAWHEKVREKMHQRWNRKHDGDTESTGNGVQVMPSAGTGH